MPDRYADAVRARRAELRVRRELLTGGHRAELRTSMALSRLAVAAETGAALAGLAREARVHAESGDRDARARLPALLAAAVDDIAGALHTGWAAALRPALRRIATERGLAMAPGWPRLPAPRLAAVSPAPPEAGGAVGSLLAGAADGAALWRLALFPLAVLPLLGLPALGGPALAPLAIGAGVAAVVVAARSRRTAGERIRLRRHVDEVIAVAAAALDADLGRRLLELERTAGAALDAAVLHSRAEVDAELALLTADRPAQVHRG
jgi:hypothetical protein